MSLLFRLLAMKFQVLKAGTFQMELAGSFENDLRISHYVGKVTKNRVPPCSAVILPLTWCHRHLDCKSKKFSSDMVRSGL